MPFDSNDPRLTAFALGELDNETERLAVAAEIETDPDALAFVEGIKETASWLSAELGKEPKLDLDPGQRSAIERQLVVETATVVLPLKTTSASPTQPGRSFPWGRYAFAASLLGLAGLSALAFQYVGKRDAKAPASPRLLAQLEREATIHAPQSSARANSDAPTVRTSGKEVPTKWGELHGNAKPSAPTPSILVTPLATAGTAPVDPNALYSTVPPMPALAAPSPPPGPAANADRYYRESKGFGATPAPSTPLGSVARRTSPAKPAPDGAGYGGGKPQDLSYGYAATPPQGGPNSRGDSGPRNQAAQNLAMGLPAGSNSRTEPAPADFSSVPAPAEPRSRGVDPAAKPEAGAMAGAGRMGRTGGLGEPGVVLSKKKGDADAKRGLVAEESLLRQKAEPGLAVAPPAMPAPVVRLAESGKKDGEAKPGAAKPGEPGQAVADREGVVGILADGTVISDLKVPDALAPAPVPNREQYAPIVDNPFLPVLNNELSTFSIDVDTASYANVRRFLNQNQRPPKDAVRIEEMLNYFTYDDPAPKDARPFALNVEAAACPWNAENRLVRVALKARTIAADKRPPSNLVFLIDVSGSMSDLNKLPLLKAGIKLLVDQLGENDRVAIVVYAGEAKVLLPSTPCHRKKVVADAIESLVAGGSTAGGAGMELAYREATQNLIKGGTNRVILGTDGDFNVGMSTTDLLKHSEERAKTGVFLSVLGFGEGNLQEAFMEQLADKGNGHYAYIDSIQEARKVLVGEMSGTLVTVAKDVKIQVEFNPSRVRAYRLIGYENRVMAAQDFRDDKKDAGEIGAGHGVTALYEITPTDAKASSPLPTKADRPLKYAKKAKSATTSPAPAAVPAADADPELLTVFLRYKAPDGDKAQEIEQGVADKGQTFGQASRDFKFSASVAGFGMLLRDSPYKGSLNFSAVAELAEAASLDDKTGYRREFVELVKKAQTLMGQ